MLRNRWIFIVPVMLMLAASADKPKDYSRVLPGVVKINDQLYYDKVEVNNFNWLEYLYWLSENHEGGRASRAYRAAVPDTVLLDQIFRPGWSEGRDDVGPEPIHPGEWGNLYLRHPSYRDYPVTGITWDQARLFCAWRTERVKEYLIREKKLDKAPGYFNYRLPTKEEWSLAAGGQADLSAIYFEKQNEARIRWNLGAEAMTADDAYERVYLYPGATLWHTEQGAFHLVGNAAEWLMDQNTFMGGDWMSADAANASVVSTSDHASVSIGFRCVCEVQEEHW